MCRYAFSFALKLTTTLLQKLATFHMRNVKKKDDGIDQNTLHYCYGEYMTTNQQTWIKKTCCRDFESLPSDLTFKDLLKFIIFRWISLSLVKLSWLEK